MAQGLVRYQIESVGCLLFGVGVFAVRAILAELASGGHREGIIYALAYVNASLAGMTAAGIGAARLADSIGTTVGAGGDAVRAVGAAATIVVLVGGALWRWRVVNSKS